MDGEPARVMKSGVSSFPEKSADDGNLKNLRGERERWRWWKVEEGVYKVLLALIIFFLCEVCLPYTRATAGV